MNRASTFLAVALALLAQSCTARPDPTHGWTSLVNGHDLSGWHPREQTDDPWLAVKDVLWNPHWSVPRLEPVGQAGAVLLNGRTGRSADLVSEAAFGDQELSVEFLVPPKSNSGIYLHGLYEVQILERDVPTEGSLHDCGAIYQRWIDGKGVGGRAPLRRACKPAGQWQSFRILFRAPRFSAKGAKIANARFLQVWHNGVIIHQDVEVDGPTRASLEIPEAPRNPLLLQGDHGPVAFRNLRTQPLTQPD